MVDVATPLMPSLLVVEDSETQALVIRRTLERHGFHVDRAASAEAALDHLNRKLPDLVIADYHLPGMNGGELSRQIRLNSRTRSIPLLMLTEAAEADTERDGLESGADAYVSKSADMDFMILRIRALLRQRLPGQSAGEDRTAPGPEPFRRIRFLVVDDDPSSSGDNCALLRRDGYLVDAVSSLDAARDFLTEAAPPVDCVLVTLHATRFDSVEVCARLDDLRQAEIARRGASRFLLVGIERDGDEPKELLARAFDAGLDEFIPPALDEGVVRVRLRAIVRRKLLQDEMQQAEVDRRDRAVTMERAKMAEAMSQANIELAAINTKLVETQAKLVQAAKMASLGELVAGIAHEINNPLAFILAHQGTVERLLSKVAAGEGADEATRATMAKARDRTMAMGTGLKRIQDLVLNLRRFSRMDEGGFQNVDIAEAIDTVVTLLGPKLGDRVAITRRYDGPSVLWCSPALLNQVVMNIVSNAADAITGPGKIAIATGVEMAMGLAGDGYVIQIDDSGPGVPPALQERVFEPFFTTKDIGSGTGLGLAIAYTVVQAHKGTITVGRSALGGASFRIVVPMMPATGE